jgi:sugar/nucleoside kinase (ribokinase family)
MGSHYSVAVVGDANVDLVLRGDVRPRFGQVEQLLDAAELVLGSSAGIAAAGLARLGVDTSLIACVGTDLFGSFVLDALRERGVGTSGIRPVPGTPTGASVILSEPHDRSILTLLGTIPEVTPDDVLGFAGPLDHVHFASYWLTPAIIDGFVDLAARLHERGAVVSLDTNWDPSEAWSGMREVLEATDYFLPNVVELRAVAAVIDPALAAADDEDCARAIAGLGTHVVVKAGAAGGWSMSPDGVRSEGAGLVLDPVDTTGAGDSFDAGYIAALAADVADESERLRWAAVAGSLSTRADGGTAAQATLAELRAAMGAGMGVGAAMGPEPGVGAAMGAEPGAGIGAESAAAKGTELGAEGETRMGAEQREGSGA